MEKGYIIQATSWEDLDWSCLLDRESSVGWIAPDGTWFGCEPKGHRDLAKWFLKSDENTLEKNGWIRVDRDAVTRKIEWYALKMRITVDQTLTLRKRGFEVESWRVNYE